MEPKILLIGRTQEVIDILIEELKPFGRNIFGSNDKDAIKKLLEKENIDFAVIGAGLPDEVRNDMKEFLLSIRSNLTVNLIERIEKGVRTS